MIFFIISLCLLKEDHALHNSVYKQIKFNRLIIKLGLNKQCLNILNNFNYYDYYSGQTKYTQLDKL